MAFINKIKGRKPIRTISGVTPLAVMVKPRKCKHGSCVYCPELDVPKSYLPGSPVVLRASVMNYNPYKQVKARLKAYEIMDHPTDKIELIIMGGTFLFYPKKYQYDFIKKCYDALNNKNSKNLEEAKKINEKAKNRCVTLCIETRPDFCGKKEIERMLEFGATRCEIGVQSPDDEIYRIVNRGHKVKDVIKATKLLKDASFKVGYHLMVNLPGSNLEKDLKMFKKIFSDENFKPDQIKIYPTQVVEGAKLVQWYEKGKYSSYSEKELVNLLAKIKSIIPKYCRVIRIMREIPRESLISGTKRIDLRNVVKEEMKKQNLKCECIRCREVGYRKKVDEKSIKLYRIDYDASGGEEIFLSYEDRNNVLISLLRLRISNKKAMIREIHTYGPEVEIGKEDKNKWQHKGFGKKLMKEAERITKKEFKINKLTVIAGVGVKEWFYNLNYKKDGYYVSKNL